MRQREESQPRRRTLTSNLLPTAGRRESRPRPRAGLVGVPRRALRQAILRCLPTWTGCIQEKVQCLQTCMTMLSKECCLCGAEVIASKRCAMHHLSHLYHDTCSSKFMCSFFAKGSGTTLSTTRDAIPNFFIEPRTLVSFDDASPGRGVGFVGG